jgi:uncharacterized protein
VRTLGPEAIRDIAYGSAVLGTGGGGDPYLGTLAALHASRTNAPPVLVDADELPDDATVAFPFVVGSPVPLVEKLPFGPELVRVLSALEEHLGRPIDAVMSAEIGGANSMVPIVLAAQAGIPVVDGDLIGRAFPEIQLTCLTMHGIGASPMAIGDERDNVSILDLIDNHWIERVARAISVSFGAICVAAAYAISGRQARELTLRGTIDYAERIGREIRLAVAEKRDPLQTLLDVTDGSVLFRGKIVDVDRRTQHGWALGTAVLEGIDDDAGRTMTLRFQNENLAADVDGAIVASVPDLITVIDAETGRAIMTEQLRYGFRVVVIGMACHPIWTTEAGLALAGPQHWGYEYEYTPLAGEYPPARGGWTAPSLAAETLL